MQDKASKCELHPGSPSVAGCDGCGRALCLECAIPVRGKVLGSECLPENLMGEHERALPPDRHRAIRYPLSGLGFAVAVVASLLPWKKYGLGSGPFGAWGWTPRWSILAAISAAVGLLLWATISLAGMKPGPSWRLTLRITAGSILIGGVLHLLRRPGFGPHSIGPWVAMAGAVLALAGTSLRRDLASERGSAGG